MPCIRKASTDMSASDWDRFRSVWQALNDKGKIDEYTKLHAMYAQHSNMSMPMAKPIKGPRGNNILFLFWHSRLIAAFEADMHAVDDRVVLPYHNFVNEPSGPKALHNFLPAVTPSRHGRVWQPYREWGRSAKPPNQDMITAAMRQDNFDNFSGVWEGAWSGSWGDGYHNQVHNWVGGSMGTMAKAAGDPLFWLHHCFIDYGWVHWRSGGTMASGMPPAGAKLEPWDTACLAAYNSSQATYYAPGAVPTSVPAERVTGLDLNTLIQGGTNGLGSLIQGGTNGLGSLIQGGTNGLGSLIQGGTTPQSAPSILDIFKSAPQPTTAPGPFPASLFANGMTGHAKPVATHVGLTVTTVPPTPVQARDFARTTAPWPNGVPPTISGKAATGVSLCRCGRPLGHVRVLKR